MTDITQEEAALDAYLRSTGGWLARELASCDCQKAEEARIREESRKNKVTLEQAMAEIGLTPPSHIPIKDGITRFQVEGRKDKSGWVKRKEYGYASFGDWSTGASGYWSEKSKSDMTPDELAALRAKMQADREAEALQREKDYANAAKKAAEIISSAKPATEDNDYISKKKVKPHGALQDAAGNLIIPMINADGEIVNAQTVYVTKDDYHEPGDKRPIKGGLINGCFLPVEVAGRDTLILCEGWATGATLAEQNPEADVIAAINAGNLPVVAGLMKERYSKIIIAGDDDRKTERERGFNPGRDAAEKAAKACGGTAVFPSFPDGCTDSDFNGAVVDGGSAVVMGPGKAISDRARELADAMLVNDADELAKIAAQEWLIDDVLPAESMVMMYGASGTGKSFVALDLAMNVASGRDWHSFEAGSRKRRHVIYITVESVGGMRRRKLAWERYNGLSVPEVHITKAVVLMDNKQELRDLRDAIELISDRIGASVGLVVIDTLANNMSGDENTAKDATAFIRGCSELRNVFGCSIMIIHHTGKDAEKGARGSSAFRGAMDMEIKVTGGVDEGLTVSCTKAKDVEQFSPLELIMEKITLPEMVDHKGRNKPDLVPRQMKMMEKARKLAEINSGEQAVLDAFSSLGVFEAQKSDLQSEFFMHQNMSNRGTDGSKRSAFAKAVKSLIEEKHLLIDLGGNQLALSSNQR